MATNTERIVELEKTGGILDFRLTTAEEAIDEHKKCYGECKQAITDLQLANEKRLTALEHKVEVLQKSTDTLGNRVFSIILMLVSAVVGGAIALGGNALIRVWFGK
jgi:hypothetical protein